MLVDGTMSVFGTVAFTYLDVQLEMDALGRNIVVLTLLVVSFLTTPCTVLLATWLKNYYGDDAYAGKPLLTFAIGYNGVVTLIASGALAGDTPASGRPPTHRVRSTVFRRASALIQHRRRRRRRYR